MSVAVVLAVLVTVTTVFAVSAVCLLRGRRCAAGRLPGPGVSLLAVTALVYVNQVLFTVYVLRVRHGDVSFVAAYLPTGWFDLDTGPLLTALARHFPHPELLAPTVLRVQAFLELPFVVFGYLTLCRWLSPAAYRAGRWLVPFVSVSYTAAFCLIEWTLRSPYTATDLAMRVVAAVAVPLWVRRQPADAPPRAADAVGLLVFAARALALGVVVLVVYDTALLYNLGHVARALPVLAAAVAVLVASRIVAPRLPRREPGVGVDAFARAFGWFLVAFFVPALPIRYCLAFGNRYVALAAGLVLVAVAGWRGLGEVHAAIRGSGTAGTTAAWAAQLGGSVAAALAAAAVAVVVLPGARYPEVRLLEAAIAFAAVAVATCAVVDRIRERPSH